jgi:hypothetical protein
MIVDDEVRPRRSTALALSLGQKMGSTQRHLAKHEEIQGEEEEDKEENEEEEEEEEAEEKRETRGGEKDEKRRRREAENGGQHLTPHPGDSSRSKDRIRSNVTESIAMARRRE